MKGFSLCHLAVMMNQDEIQLIHNLYPDIIRGEIILHEPDPPFDQLPKILAELSSSPRYTTALIPRKLVNTVVELSKNATQAHPDIPGENIAPVQGLPQFFASSGEKFQELTIPNNINHPTKKVITATGSAKKSYKIVSVDDSFTIIKEISRFLENENFTVVAINEPLKAIVSIIRHKRNLILLDFNMAGIDGYELCRVIRNNSI